MILRILRSWLPEINFDITLFFFNRIIMFWAELKSDFVYLCIWYEKSIPIGTLWNLLVYFQNSELTFGIWMKLQLQGDQLNIRLDINVFKIMVLNNRWELEHYTLTLFIMNWEAKNFQKNFQKFKKPNGHHFKFEWCNGQKIFLVPEHIMCIWYSRSITNRFRIST